MDFMLYPAANNPDADALSDRDNLGAFQFFSRLGLRVDDFEQNVLGADVSGYVETDFFGPTGDVQNTLRVRRAFAKMSWDNRDVQFGMEWSPLFTLGAFPHTVASEAGTPFNPFARQPMIKLTLRPTETLRLIGATAWQMDAFVDAGLSNAPSGTEPQGGIDAQQQAAIPGLHGHAQYVTDRVTLGLGGYLKALRPFPLGERFFGGAGTAYAAYSGDPLVVRGKLVYGTARDHIGIGGYLYDPAAAGNDVGAADAFQQINTLSTWVEVEKAGTIAPGLFAGYVTNLGVADVLDGPTSGVAFATRGVDPDGQSLASVWEVAPRLALNYGPMRFALEVQVTTAQYTARLDDHFAPDPADAEEPVTNVRGDLSVFLFF
ncbi:hypothetical protein [Salinibacter altiplanensis]|uniref:hypothetical protein n=1 Tax=Salinibacter altiplanensis TaxID=1803181 RepID=UPI00131A36EE|nr:hypothetical protein [Salinibacter altiplanensis]